MSDTVGFIDRLPHTLVAAFRATLEEVVAADLLLHVIDAGYAGRRASRGGRQAHAGGGRRRRRAVDRRVQQVRSARPGRGERLERREPDALCVSAATGLGRADLVDAITARLALDVRRIVVKLDLSLDADRQRLAQIYRFGRVDQHTEQDGEIWIEADVPQRLWSRLQRGGPVRKGRAASAVLAALVLVAGSCAPVGRRPS